MDGLDSHLLLEQRYSASDDLTHIRSLIPLFSDHRYIRVMDRPLFLVIAPHNYPSRKGRPIFGGERPSRRA